MKAYLPLKPGNLTKFHQEVVDPLENQTRINCAIVLDQGREFLEFDFDVLPEQIQNLLKERFDLLFEDQED
jgi:hypothetical protein